MKNEETDIFPSLENAFHFEIQIVMTQVEKIKASDISFIIPQ